MQLNHVSLKRAIDEDEARTLLNEQNISLEADNPMLLASMNLLECLRRELLWTVAIEKEALQEDSMQAPDLVILTNMLKQGLWTITPQGAEDHFCQNQYPARSKQGNCCCS